MAIYTLDQILEKQGKTVNDIKPVGVAVPSETENVKPSLTSKIGKTLSEGGTQFEQTIKDNTKSPLERGVSAVSGSFNTVGKVIGNVVGSIPGVDKLKPVGEAIGTGISSFAKPVIDNKLVQAYSQDLNKTLQAMFPNLGEDGALKITSEIGNIANTILGAEVGTGALGKTGQLGKETISKVGDIAESGLSKVDNLATKAGEMTSGVRDIVRPTLETVKNIPQRASINMAERKAVEQTIQKLPTESAKVAVREGIELPDVEYLYQIPKSQKAPLNTLFKVVEDFATGKSKTNPIEIVGKPIVKRIQDLETRASTIGKQLGDTANKLPDVTDIEIQPVVLGELQKVNGLRGLKIADDGVLDFTDTSLASALSKSDQTAIQSAYETAIKSGTGKQKHLLRQELFEILGGKKKSLTNITDTQEKAYEAIRKGLSDALEVKDKSYKTLSNEYRKTIQPLQDMRKFMKNVAGADEDILDMSAGLLARRLTSNAGSNPQLRQILRNLDNATKVKGKTSLSIENLQDFYNVIEKYYPEITGKTTLKGQVEGALENVGGIGDLVSKVGQKVIGKSEAVKRKVLRDAIIDALK